MRPLTKEEEEVEVMQSWVEAGGFPACPEEEAKELLAEVSSFSWFFILSMPPHLVIGTELLTPFIFSFRVYGHCNK